MSFDIEENDEEHIAPVIDLTEYRKQKAYNDFWSDPCWTEPLDETFNTLE